MARLIEFGGSKGGGGGGIFKFEGPHIVFMLCMILASMSIFTIIIFACGDSPDRHSAKNHRRKDRSSVNHRFPKILKNQRSESVIIASYREVLMGTGGGEVSFPLKEPPMTFQCPILTCTNYNSWSIKIEAIMDAQGLWDAIQQPTDGAVIDPRMVKRARAFLLQALPEDLLLQVAAHKEAKDIWNALKTRFSWG